MFAVLEQALGHLRLGGIQTRRARRLFLDAAFWVLADDEHWPYSFRNICATLELDPASVRARLARRYRLAGLATRRRTRRAC